MFCTNCGKESDDDAKFCASCGIHFETAAGIRPSTSPEGGARESMTFTRSISTCFSKYFNFKGRASRAEYWWFYLFCFLVYLVALLLDSSEFFAMLVSLLLFFPSITVGARRLHDTGRSGWWQLLSLTVIGLIPLMFWFASRGSDRGNRYGNAL